MKAKVCHLTSTHNRYDVRIFLKECISLVRNGYDVTLIVNDNQPDEIINGVKIISTGFFPKNRIEKFIYSNNKIFKKAVAIKADIYHFHDPDLLMVGNKLQKLGAKVIFDSHEDVPQQIKDKYWIPKVLRYPTSKLYEFYESHSVKKYNAIISVTPHIVNRLQALNVNTKMITNYPIIESDNNVNHQVKDKSICFAGGISEQWNHHSVINVIEGVENLTYKLAGTGDPNYLEQLKNMSGWNKVEYMGKIPYREVKDIYNSSMIGMALNTSSQASKEGTLGNTKLFEIMSSGIPVICSNNKIWKEIVETYKCGIAINPNDKNSIKNAIIYLFENPKLAQEMGDNGKKAVNDVFNWETQEVLLLNIYEQL